MIPAEADRAQCSADHWHEDRLLYREDAPLSIYAPGEDDEADYQDAGGGAWIYWRGKRIEHYTYPYEQLADARELTDLCFYLEDVKGRVRSLYFDGRAWHKVRHYTDQIEPWKTVRAALHASWLRDPFDYHAMDSLGWTTASMGQGRDAGQLYAPFDGVLAWMQAHKVFPHFLEADGGPWCFSDDAAECPGCAGEIPLPSG